MILADTYYNLEIDQSEIRLQLEQYTRKEILPYQVVR